MSFQAEVNQELIIDNVRYRIAEHPAAPGFPYGQEGRQATVYQVLATAVPLSRDARDKRYALKVFKPHYRFPALADTADQLATFADLPGLQVCRRTVIIPQRHTGLLRLHADLAYAVLMPWIEGPTWMEIVEARRVLTPEQSRTLAGTLASILHILERRNIAHCDLSGSNVLLPCLSPSPTSNPLSSVELVDVEQLYAPNLVPPDILPAGSPGYAHRTAAKGLWEAQADRFAGAVLIAEMLGWCDKRVCDAAWGESYFHSGELQQETERYQTLVAVLHERWGSEVTELFKRAWYSETLADCPTFAEWLVKLPTRKTTLALGEQPPAKTEAETEVLIRVLKELQRFYSQGEIPKEPGLVPPPEGQAVLAPRDPSRSEVLREIQKILDKLKAQENSRGDKLSYELVLVNGESYRITPSQTIIGRSSPKDAINPDIVLDKVDQYRVVSRPHCRIFLSDGYYYIEDLDSRNGTLLNGQRLAPRKPYRLTPGDQITLGFNVHMAFRLAKPADTEI